MKRKISDSVVVITGASSGIGRAAAMGFARQGAALLLAARGQEQLETIAKDCKRFTAHALVVPCDVCDFKAVEELAKTAMEKFGRIDVWVNNAAVTLFGRLEEAPLEHFRKVIETNLFGYIHGARAVIPHFRQQGSGILINNASMIGKLGSPYVSAYSISKFGIVGLSESLRQELLDAPNIHVCTVLPASIDTPLFQHAANYTGRAVKPLDPILPAEDVAQEIVKLAAFPKREVYVGGSGLMMSMLRSLAPGTAERMMARQVEKNHFTDAAADASEGNLYQPMPQWSCVSGQWRTASHNDSKGRLMGLAVPLFAAGLAAFLLYRKQDLSIRGLTENVITLGKPSAKAPQLKGLSHNIKGKLADKLSWSWFKTRPQYRPVSGRANGLKEMISSVFAA